MISSFLWWTVSTRFPILCPCPTCLWRKRLLNCFCIMNALMAFLQMRSLTRNHRCIGVFGGILQPALGQSQPFFWFPVQLSNWMPEPSRGNSSTVPGLPPLGHSSCYAHNTLTSFATGSFLISTVYMASTHNCSVPLKRRLALHSLWTFITSANKPELRLAPPSFDLATTTSQVG